MNLSIRIRELWIYFWRSFRNASYSIHGPAEALPFSNISSSNIFIYCLPIFVCLQLTPASVTIYAKK